MKHFNDLKQNLTQDDIDSILAIIGFRCRLKTVNRLRSILTYGPSMIPQYGILTRLVKDKDQWEYIAGQSYPDEIRTLREVILNG